tara:strand:- start:108 stop:524 length:417 start_codon:yes stop_codon:yes gene_type:complete
MSLIKECQICGNRISFRKMPHGKYVAFDVKTNDRHVHSKAEINKIKKIKKNEDQKEIEIKKDNNKKISKKEQPSQDEFNQSEEFEAYEISNNDDIFKNDTLESLRSEIDNKVSEKKDNKTLIFTAVAIIIALIFVFNK